MRLYFSNSAAQAAYDSGGSVPVTSFHSVIDRPDSVSRVMPPTITISMISAATANSQLAMAFGRTVLRNSDTRAVYALETANASACSQDGTSRQSKIRLNVIL